MADKKDNYNQPCIDCGEVCEYQQLGLRIIKKFVKYTEAARECEKRGWRLADITTGQSDQANWILSLCNQFEGSSSNSVWVRSFNGVSSKCPILVSDDLWPGRQLGAYWAYSDCEEAGELTVLCEVPESEDDGPAQTCTGVWEGSVVRRTEDPILTTTFISTTPSLTVTVTRTECQCGHFGCDPDCWDWRWDDEFEDGGVKPEDREFF